ncbi:MAG: hypothetical protein EZS28_048028, partial [Streblomastix strix]
ITNCTCVQSTKTRRHTETKYQIAAIFKGLPDVQVELEPGAGHNKQGGKTKNIPDVVITWNTKFHTYNIESSLLGGTITRQSHNIRKIGLDLVVVDEDSGTAGRYTQPEDIVHYAEMQKINTYKDFYKEEDYHVIPFGITTRGTLGAGANSIINLAKEMARQMKRQLPIGQIKKEIMCILKKSDTLMKSIFERCINQKMKVSYKELQIRRETEEIMAENKMEINSLRKQRPRYEQEKLLSEKEYPILANTHYNPKKQDNSERFVYNRKKLAEPEEKKNIQKEQPVLTHQQEPEQTDKEKQPVKTYFTRSEMNKRKEDWTNNPEQIIINDIFNKETLQEDQPKMNEIHTKQQNVNKEKQNENNSKERKKKEMQRDMDKKLKEKDERMKKDIEKKKTQREILQEE